MGLGLLAQLGVLLTQDVILKDGHFIATYTALQLFAIVTLVLPRWRDSKWTLTTAKRNALVVLYIPVLSFPFFLLAFLARSDVPIKVLFTYVFPFEFLFNFFGNSGSMDGTVVLWSLALTLLSLLLNYRMVFSAWAVLVNLKHPSLEPVIRKTSNREHDEAS